MDQFGEMSKTKQVVHAETNERGTAGKRTLKRQICRLGFSLSLTFDRLQQGGIICSDGLGGWMD